MPLYRNNKFVVDVYRNNKVVQKIYRGATLVYGAIEEVLVNISGKILTLVNGTRVESLEDFKLYGKSEQTQYQGYQLLNFEDTEETTLNGITYSIKDGVITLNGTATAYFSIQLNFNIEGDYYFSSSFEGSQSGNAVYRFTIDSQNKFFTRSSKTLITGKITNFRVYVDNGATATNLVLKPMLEKGTIEHNFEPYVGGIPSPSPQYPQEIKSVENPIVNFSGKNIYNNSFLGEVSTRTTSVTFNIISIDRLRISFFRATYNYGLSAKVPFPAIKGKTYTISYKFETNSVYTESQTPRIRLNASEPTLTGSAIGYETITAESDVIWLYVYMYHNSSLGVATYTEFYDIQIEESSVATDYEPYHEPQSYQFDHTLYGIPVLIGGNYTDETDQQWIADYVDVENKKLWHYLGLSPVLTWEYSISVNGNRWTSNALPTRKMGSFNLLCSHHKVTKSITIANMNDFEIKGNETDGRFIYIKDTNKSINPNNENMEIIFELETPYSEDLTDSEVQAFLQMKTYKPTTIVSNNYDAHMSASYHTKLEQLDVAMTREYNNLINELKGE